MKNLKTRIYNDIGRIYVFDDNSQYYSVTTMLGATADKRALKEWQERIGLQEAQRQTEYAATIGTQMHEALEYFMLNKKEPSYPNSVIKNMVKQIIPYLSKRVYKVYYSELLLYSDNLKLAGTADGIVDYYFKNNVHFCVLDFKTSKKYKKPKWIVDYLLQLALYAIMYEEIYGQKIDYGVLLFAYKEKRQGQKEFIVHLDAYKKMAIERNKKFQKLLTNKNSLL